MTRIFSNALMALALFWALPAAADQAPPTAAGQEAVDDAWWTGPLLTLPAETLPKGGVDVGTALWDTISEAPSANEGRQNQYGLLPFVLYGVSDDFNLGFFPSFGLTQISRGQMSSGAGLGDTALEVEYRLHDFHQGEHLPTISLDLAESFPTGRYDQLNRVSEGLGAGTYATTLSLFTQDWFWTPTGRILRAELNLSATLNTRAGLRGMSVYGTSNGFLGHADPGASFAEDLTLEYSLSRNWSAAAEFQLQRNGATRIAGEDGPAAIATRAPASQALYVAPYVEYNWSATQGTMLGVRVFAGGHNQTASVMPMVLFNWYLGSLA